MGEEKRCEICGGAIPMFILGICGACFDHLDAEQKSKARTGKEFRAEIHERIRAAIAAKALAEADRIALGYGKFYNPKLGILTTPEGDFDWKPGDPLP